MLKITFGKFNQLKFKAGLPPGQRGQTTKRPLRTWVYCKSIRPNSVHSDFVQRYAPQLKQQYILLFSSYCGHFVYITNIFSCLPRAFKETIRISFHYVLCVFLIVRSQTLYAAVLANSGLFYYKIDIESQWEYSWLNTINDNKGKLEHTHTHQQQTMNHTVYSGAPCGYRCLKK